MAQTQMPVQDQQFSPHGDPRENRTRNVNLPQGNDTQDWEALPNDTLDQYKVNYPEQAESLQQFLTGYKPSRPLLIATQIILMSFTKWPRRQSMVCVKLASNLPCLLRPLRLLN